MSNRDPKLTTEQLAELTTNAIALEDRWPTEEQWYEAIRHIVRNCPEMDFTLERHDGPMVHKIHPKHVIAMAVELVGLRARGEKLAQAAEAFAGTADDQNRAALNKAIEDMRKVLA